MSNRHLLCAIVAGCLIAVPAFGAAVQINNLDPPGIGLNDPGPPVLPAPGNDTAATVGEQRLNVLQRAAEIWANNLISAVPITINAQTALQTCTATSAVLASAGANVVEMDFANAPLAGTWYHGALANSIAGVDLSPADSDITTQFNRNLDEDPTCLGGVGWYYGFDHNEGVQVDLLAVMLHEYGHGLGFANFVNEAAGTLFLGSPDVYTTFTRDLETGVNWNDMTNGERAASAINDPDVVWTGAAVTAVVPGFLDPAAVVIVNTPPIIAGEYPAQTASFGPPVPMGGVTGDVVLAQDGGGPGTATDACEALTNGAAISGNIALVDRGECNFTVKVANAQAVGATAVLVANNQPSGLPPMGGDDPSITIPSLGIEMSTGDAIKAQLGGGVNATAGFSATELAGVNSGFLRLHAPDPVAPGSSISHWTTAAEPSLLMEPSITSELTDDVDLTLDHFTDIGWLLGLFQDGFESGDTTRWSTTVP